MLIIIGILLIGFGLCGANADSAVMAGAICLVANAIDNLSNSIDDWRRQSK